MAEYIKRSDTYIKRSDLFELARECNGEEAVPVRIIKNIPVADVVSVVRCKDCYHSTPHTNTRCMDCHVFCIALPDDFYCKYGRKKDGIL